MDTLLSMTAFAIAASLSPGPVNLMALGYGTRYGLRRSLRHVGGATLGFTSLLLLTGFGLGALLAQLPWLLTLARAAGCAYLLWLAWLLLNDDGAPSTDGSSQRAPSYATGALMQWLNPKAWLAALAGCGVFTADDPARLWQFAALYAVVCYACIACWAWADARLRQHLQTPRALRGFNRTMAVLLACSTLLLLR